MRVLVLGGTQFVGRALAMRLIACDHDVSILTRGRRPVEYGGLRRRYRADRKDPASLCELRSERFDAVFDVSGYTAEDVRPVLDALRLGEGVRYVFVSSGAVYRPSSVLLAEDAPKGENANWGPYGLGKLAAEELLAARQPELGYMLSLIRPAYIYGPGNNLYREAFLFDRLARGLAIPVPQGSARTQFVYIDDLVRMMEGLLRRKPWSAEAFNCTNPEPISWDDLVCAAAAAAGVEPHIQQVDYRGVMEPREFFPFRNCTYLLDTGKSERFGLEQPATALGEGMRKSYEWYRACRPRLSDPKMTQVEEALRR